LHRKRQDDERPPIRRPQRACANPLTGAQANFAEAEPLKFSAPWSVNVTHLVVDFCKRDLDETIWRWNRGEAEQEFVQQRTTNGGTEPETSIAIRKLILVVAQMRHFLKGAVGKQMCGSHNSGICRA
jgi:hypothetical protein